MVRIGTIVELRHAELERIDEVHPGRVARPARNSSCRAAAARMPPTTMPSNTAILAKKPLEYCVIEQDHDQHEQRDAHVVERAEGRVGKLAARRRRRPCGRSSSAGRRAQLMPMRMSETPITMMIVPVTTGGKSGSSRLMSGATRMREDAGRDDRAVDRQQHARRIEASAPAAPLAAPMKASMGDRRRR